MKEPRIKRGVSVEDLFPTPDDGTCACGCGVMRPPRRTRWATDECVHNVLTTYRIWKGDPSTVRSELFRRDGGICAHCKKIAPEWQADHIVAVVNGGGGCGLEGYQTLCTPCHKKKTKADLCTRLEELMKTAS